MVDAISVALSGLKANTTKVGVHANNIANAGNIGARRPEGGPAPYTPQDVVMIADALGGVQTRVTDRDPAFVLAPDPGSAYADDNGVVAVPNVDMATEIVGMNIAKNSYAANAAVIKVASAMQDEVMRLVDKRV